MIPDPTKIPAADSGLTQDLSHVLFAYSEWLDREGLVISDVRDAEDTLWFLKPVNIRKLPGEDCRSHEQLVADFLAQSGT